MSKKKYNSLDEAIKDIYGASRRVSAKRYVSGGDINEAAALTLDDGTVLFMKSNSEDFLPVFEAESEGLEAIRETGAIGAAKVLGLGKDSGRAFLLLEYINSGRRIGNFWEIFAAELAAMHRADAGEHFGFPHDNWIGATAQKNRYYDSWIDFFRDCRLKVQFDLAMGHFSKEERRKIDYLLGHLDQYLVEPDRPSLVHGDLWAGNMITGDDGKGWLIDPAAYCGHPEVDIAMTELFGGYAQPFYDAYRETGMLQAGYEDRRDLYNLYQLLNHLNMFGSSYLGSVLRIVGRYAG